MKISFSSLALVILAELASAGPIYRDNNVLRHANTPQKRYVAKNLPTLHHAKRQAQGTVSSIDPFATPNPDATEDGGVPAVGVGGDVNTSLLPSLTDPAVTSEAAAFATASDSVQAAQASTVVTNAAVSTTADTVAQQTITENVQAASESPSILDSTASAVDPNAAISTTILPIGALTNAASSTPVDAGAQPQVPTTVQADITIQTTLETTVVDSAAATQNTVVTDQSGQTLALANDLTTTQIAGVALPTEATASTTTDAAEQATPSAAAAESQPSTSVDPNNAQGTSVVDVNTNPDSPTEAPEVTNIFVTASPTFSGPTAGFITLDSNGNVVGSTALATDSAAAQATDADVTESPTTQVAAASTTAEAPAEQAQPQDQQLTTTTIFIPESSLAPSGTFTTTVFVVAPPAASGAGETAAAPPIESSASSEPQPQPTPSQPTAAPEAPAATAQATNSDDGITVVPVTPGNAAADTAQPLTTAAPVPTGLVIGQVLSGQVVTVTETVTETVTAA